MSIEDTFVNKIVITLVNTSYGQKLGVTRKEINLFVL